MEKEMFVIEFPLKVEKWQADILDKRYEHLRKIYNYAQGKLVRQYDYLTQMKEYRRHGFSKEYERMLADKGNEKALRAIKAAKDQFFRDHPFHISGISDSTGGPMGITFSSFGIPGFIEKLASHRIGAETTYSDLGINSLILGLLGKQLWAAWDRMINDPNTEKVSFKKHGELNSFATRVKGKEGKKVSSGMNLYLDTMTLDIKVNGKTGRNAKFISLPIVYNLKHADYEMNALHGGLDSIKVIKVLRRLVRGSYKYYLQLTIGDEKPQKGRQLGKGRVNIDLGLTKIAVYSDAGVMVRPLAPSTEKIDHQILLVQRKMDRSRRTNNPGYFNADGTIKELEKGERRRWTNSEEYKRLRMQKTELQRRQAAVRKQDHIALANELLKLGNVFVIEDNDVKEWQQRKKEASRREEDGKNLSQAGFGKHVGNHAPSMFVTILENKVKSLGGTFVKVDTNNGATEYDFTNDTFTKHDLTERYITLSDGKRHQRDTLAAFNLAFLCLDPKKKRSYNRENMRGHYDRFCQMEETALKSCRSQSAVGAVNNL